ncbi:MAG: NAD-dependent epimerase/dehydratase family protein [Sandaracinaceae bacterium]|nr:NAD-dependent epimerase/dehydratase family protein [Sandaracinaceae bacterium]
MSFPPPEAPTDAPVLVTGATGYVAGRVIERLLAEGLVVHATVRDASKTDRLRYLVELAEASPGSIRFFSADLLEPGSFAEAMEGCRVVFHVASPFVTDVADPENELVKPAVEGTRNVLLQANATPSVQRVVQTSSCAAIYGDSADLEATPRGVFDEEVWNTTSTLQHNPYSLSKTLAEKEAWRIAEAQDRWRLVVMNPAMVMGPGLRIHRDSESFSLLKRIIDGSFSSGMPDVRIGVVDVRDLAEAHYRAGFLPDASGRHVLSGSDASIPMVVETLREKPWKELKLPKRVLPRWVLWLVGPMAGLSRPFVSKNVGLPWKADNRKSQERLGLAYRPLAETVQDFARQIIDEGQLA